MGEEPGTSGTAVTGGNDPEQIRQEIEQTRQELGDTVEALAEKSDVKKHAHEKIDEVKAAAQDKKEQALGKKDDLIGKAREASPESALNAASQAGDVARQNPLPVAVGGAFLAGLVLGRLLARRKN